MTNPHSVDDPGALARATTLPPRWYADAEIYRREVEQVFRREWLPVGRVDQVREPGDYFSADLLGEPLVVARDKQGVVRVLSRVCRHRWMPVVEGAGRRQSFQCPYHLWTYGLDGKLLGAPEMERVEGFDRAACRLPEFRAEIWEGWILVNLDGQAPPLAPRLESLGRALAPYRLSEMVASEPMTYDSRWNWKIMVDNFIESYHHIGPHADTLQPIVPGGGTWAEDVDGPYIVLHNPAKDPDQPLALLPEIPGLSAAQRSEFLVGAVFPLLLFAVNPDSLVWYQLEPHSVDHFTLRVWVCVPPGSVGDERVAQMRMFVDAVHQQDIVACAGVQAGVSSRHAAPGRLSHLEKPIWQFDRWLRDRLS